MRIYSDKNKTELTQVICNHCRKELSVENGILKEGCVHAEIPFGYFSKKDGEIQIFDLCETCYDEIVGQFKIPPEKEERTEML